MAGGGGESLIYLYCLRMPTEIVGGWVLNVQLLTVAYGRHRWVGLINKNAYGCYTVDIGGWVK